MFLSEFLYIIKRVLSSPFVIGIVIAAFLYLELVFYILNYSKKTKPPLEADQSQNRNNKDETEEDSDDEGLEASK